MDALLWIALGGVYAVCIWIWVGPFGRQFSHRGRPVCRVQAPRPVKLCVHTHRTRGVVVPVLVAGTLAFSISGCAVSARAQHDQPAWLPLDSRTAEVDPEPTPTVAASMQPVPLLADMRADEFRFTHPQVERFVVRFQGAGRNGFRTALLRSAHYVPHMARIFHHYGLPPELVYLPLIESAFCPRAVSRVGAAGPWQFIAATGRRYGLRIDDYVDERRDPIKSTRAAARYLRQLYTTFGSWHLALAAYNTGEQHVARALATGKAADFWEMRRRGYLSDETANFVPRFLAALRIAQTPELFGFSVAVEQPLEYEVIRLKHSLSLAAVARLSGTSTSTIQLLNPALRRSSVPPGGYAVRVPKGSRAAFEVAYTGLLQPSHIGRPAAQRKALAATRQAATPGALAPCLATSL